MAGTDGQLRRRLLAGAAAVVLLLVGVLVGLAVGGDDGDDAAGDDVATSVAEDTTTTAPDDDTTTSTTATDGEPTPQGQELTDLIAQGQAASYTAAYETFDPTSQLGTVRVDVWRDGSRVRQDAVVQVEGRSVESSAFIIGDQVRACQRGSGQDQWQCQDVPRASAPDVDGRIREAVAELADRTTGGTDATIAGQAARCYDVTDDDGTEMELCVTLGGVPARLVSGNAAVELVSYADGVPDGVFEPPA